MAGADSRDAVPWHSLERSQIFETLAADSNGLSTEEAASRRAEHGPNRLPSAKPVSVWQIFLRQFKNPLIYILALAAIVSFAIGEVIDAGFIVAVLLVNALIEAIQELRAERSSKALQQLIRTRATETPFNLVLEAQT